MPIIEICGITVRKKKRPLQLREQNFFNQVAKSGGFFLWSLHFQWKTFISTAVDMILKMRDLIFYIFAAVLFIGWCVGYLIFNIGGAFHLTFLFAVIVLLIRILKDDTL